MSWADEETVYLNMLGSRSYVHALSLVDSAFEAEVAAAMAPPAVCVTTTQQHSLSASQHLADYGWLGAMPCCGRRV